MSRIKLKKGRQREFLNRVAKYFNFDWYKIAKISNVCERSLRDWKREKYNMTYGALLKLHRISNIPLPKIVKILPEYWSARKFARLGALRRYQIYGNLGTLEGRRKGGIKSQRKFHLDPEYARRVGVIVRKEIKFPPYCELLAEFIGIILGDGGITREQVRITFNRITDDSYSLFIRKIIMKLFGISAVIYRRTSGNGDDVVISSRNVVDFLLRNGLKIGSKIRNNTNAPRWILENKVYKAALIRGLVDTDGSFYSYIHYVNKKRYSNFAMCFTNYSRPILSSFYTSLVSLGFRPFKTEKRVYLHKKIDIDRYFDIIKPHNPKHLYKYNKFREFED